MFKVFSRISRRRALQGAAAGVVAFGLLLWWLLPLGDEPPTGTITFSTGTPLGVYQEYGKLLRTELDKDMPGLKVKLVNSAGSQENVARVATGHADFTIAAADAVETYEMGGKPGASELRGSRGSTTTTSSSSSRTTRTSTRWPICGASGWP